MMSDDIDSLTEEDWDEFGEVANRMTDLCYKHGICPSSIYCGCPFKHVVEMPGDCMYTMPDHWVLLLKRLAEMEGTI